MSVMLFNNMGSFIANKAVMEFTTPANQLCRNSCQADSAMYILPRSWLYIITIRLKFKYSIFMNLSYSATFCIRILNLVALTYPLSMRLINTKSLELREFFNEDTPPYAILSHAWGDQEVTFQDWQNRQQAATKRGFSKIQKACSEALNYKLDWLWVDTNCIDKSSSAELSEAINSMFAYYQKSEICFVYLVDVSTVNQDRKLLFSQIRNSRWFTRGWTIQELIAPQHLVFHAADWSRIGRKDGSLVNLFTSITKIDMVYLNGRKSIHRASVSKRMSWLAKRTTTRTEDMAYCMLGIFDINMPLLYGEGRRAFFRLQEEIIKSCNDHTIFCWEWTDIVPDNWASLLAPWPTVFEGAGDFEKLGSNEISVFSMTNAGLSIRLPTIATIRETRSLYSSWFIMLQAAPTSTILDHPEAACVRVVGLRKGDQLYVSRFPYPPRPRTISTMWTGNFKRESFLVMNRLSNGKVHERRRSPPHAHDSNTLSFMPIFGSPVLERRWEFMDSNLGNISSSSELGQITWRLETTNTQMAVVQMNEFGRCPEARSYVLLGMTRNSSCHVSAQLLSGREFGSAPKTQDLDTTIRDFVDRVKKGDSVLPMVSYNKRLGVTMVLERSMDVTTGTRNCYFMFFFEGHGVLTPDFLSARGLGERGHCSGKSDVADVTRDPFEIG